LPGHAKKVKAPDSLAPLVARLLHNVAIFRDLDAALSFKNHGNDCAVATLAGEFISAEGIVFGGSRDASADSLLERKARMSILSAEYAEPAAGAMRCCGTRRRKCNIGESEKRVRRNASSI